MPAVDEKPPVLQALVELQLHIMKPKSPAVSPPNIHIGTRLSIAPSLALNNSPGTSLTPSNVTTGKWRRLPKPLHAPSLSAVVSSAAASATASSAWLSQVWLAPKASATVGPVATLNIGTSLLLCGCLTGAPVACLTFKSPPVCHDINQFTVAVAQSRLDIVVGFATGECIWWNPLLNTRLRFNKQGQYFRGAPLVQVKWVPRSEVHVLLAFSDGTLVLMDVRRLDVVAASSTPLTGNTNQSSVRSGHGASSLLSISSTPSPAARMFSSTASTSSSTDDLDDLEMDEELDHPNKENQLVVLEHNRKGRRKRVNPVWAARLKSANGQSQQQPLTCHRDSDGDVTVPVSSSTPQPLNKQTPVLTDMAVQIMGRQLGVAVSTTAGRLFVMYADMDSGAPAVPVVTDVHSGSSYGALLCVDWSECGRWLAVGGQDDCVYIYSAAVRRLIATCDGGHSSWVTSVGFQRRQLLLGQADSSTYQPADRDETDSTFRLASVGEDSRLCLWRVVDDTVVNAGINNMEPAGCQRLTSPWLSGEAHWMPCVDVCYGADGVVSTCRLGEMRVWLPPKESVDKP